jgi:uncharacterized protein
MEKLPVEVVYALPGDQDAVELLVAPGTTLAQAVAASGVLARHPELRSSALRLGVHGSERGPRSVVRARDRIEIYRPLQVDPKEARRRRAKRPARG